jgi:uncharacterized protein
MSSGFENLGFGLGLRSNHHDDILQGQHRVQWFEAITENYLGLANIGPGPSFANLKKVREQYPVVLHGVSLSIGSTHPLDLDYLSSAKKLFSQIDPAWVSDHLCWTGVHGRNAHDLLPLPYTLEVADHVASRIHKVQEFWQRPLVIENVSSYVTFSESEMTESEFIKVIVEKTGCKLLLDVNNIYVSSRNHGFVASEFLANVPWSAIVQIHLAGHTDKGHVVIDTHDEPVRDEVWNLFREVLCYVHAKKLSASIMIERDDNIPPLAELIAELDIARKICDSVTDANAVGSSVAPAVVSSIDSILSSGSSSWDSSSSRTSPSSTDRTANV